MASMGITLIVLFVVVAMILAASIVLGRDGYVLGPGIAFVFDILRPIVERTAECRALFAGADG